MWQRTAHLLTEVLVRVGFKCLRRHMKRIDSNHHGEGLTERFALVEVQKHVLIDCLNFDPISALGEEFSKLDDVPLLEAFLVKEVTGGFVLIGGQCLSFADASSLLDLQSQRYVFR